MRVRDSVVTDASLAVLDVAPLLAGDAAGSADLARSIERACRTLGFFYATGHGIGADTLSSLEAASRRFFALPHERKMEIAMARGGRAWRGYFPVGGEQTSGKADRKQGLYFGEELPPSDPRVQAGWPLHGANLFPADVPELETPVLRFMREAERAGHAILSGIALSLGLRATYFRDVYTARPTLLFRIFEYPPALGPASDEAWGVGEHTDYGLLTLLAQDRHGGLEVKSPRGWMAAPPIEGALVCNIGDMLDRLTGGFYRSTPHRVRNRSSHTRLSFPFFLDPGFEAEIVPLPARADGADQGSARRWDNADLRTLRGTYRDYLLGKVAKVFPELATALEER